MNDRSRKFTNRDVHTFKATVKVYLGFQVRGDEEKGQKGNVSEGGGVEGEGKG